MAIARPQITAEEQKQLARFFEETPSASKLLTTLRSRRVGQGYKIETGDEDTHPVTGRKSLYLSSHAGTIMGWLVPESRDLLRDLNEHATQRENVYIHRWRQYDLVMWDNRQTMHRVRRFDETQPRDMRRTTVAGETTTAEQAEAA